MNDAPELSQLSLRGFFHFCTPLAPPFLDNLEAQSKLQLQPLLLLGEPPIRAIYFVELQFQVDNIALKKVSSS
jgi:hypothetical protein